MLSLITFARQVDVSCSLHTHHLHLHSAATQHSATTQRHLTLGSARYGNVHDLVGGVDSEDRVDSTSVHGLALEEHVGKVVHLLGNN